MLILINCYIENLTVSKFTAQFRMYYTIYYITHTYGHNPNIKEIRYKSPNYKVIISFLFLH